MGNMATGSMLLPLVIDQTLQSQAGEFQAAQDVQYMTFYEKGADAGNLAGLETVGGDDVSFRNHILEN